MQVFVLAGQSNMSGRGGVIRLDSGESSFDPLDAPELPQTVERVAIRRFTAELAWADASEPLHAGLEDQGKTPGIGPGLVFARHLASRCPRNFSSGIGLVPCALGGTSLAEWQPSQRCYVRMVERTKAALAAAPLSSLAGLLWYQGESDADMPEHVSAYEQSFKIMVDSLRADLAAPDMPVVQVAIACNSEVQSKTPLWREIRRVQLAMQHSNLVTVAADEHALQQDGLHLHSGGQAELGKRMCDAYVCTWMLQT